jgi:glycosyltransferase involved in cell wall biosynthesis
MPPLEAAALGTPCVLSDLRVFRDHFGHAAEYFDPYDPDSLARALIRMTPARRADLAPAARTRALNYGPDNEAAQWQELIRKLMPSAKIPASLDRSEDR